MNHRLFIDLLLRLLFILPLLAPTILVLTWRPLDEEALLARELPGYAAYMQRVRWRLIPGVF